MKIGIGSSWSAQQTGIANMSQTIHLAQRLGGWITPDLAARWVWPQADPKASKKTVSDLLMRAVECRWLLARSLGGRRLLYVVTKAGASWMVDDGEPGVTGTQLGHFKAGTWVPPATLTHDWRAARFLVDWATKKRQEFMTDHEFHSCNRTMHKRPDGLIFQEPRLIGEEERVFPCFWIEVEGARKSGPDLTQMVNELIAVEHGKGPTLRDQWGVLKATETMIVLPPPMPSVKHQLRIESAVRKQHPVKPVKLRFYTEIQPWKWEYAEVTVNADDDTVDDDDTWY